SRSRLRATSAAVIGDGQAPNEMAGAAGAVSAPFRAVSVPFSALPSTASAVPTLCVIGIWCTTGLGRPLEIADMAAADDEALWIPLAGVSGLDRGTIFTGTGSENYRLSRRQCHQCQEDHWPARRRTPRAPPASPRGHPRRTGGTGRPSRS